MMIVQDYLKNKIIVNSFLYELWLQGKLQTQKDLESINQISIN